ncbi:MAG: glycosyltransferase family 4 protein [Candidatus Hodarchaeota archaeon]
MKEEIMVQENNSVPKINVLVALDKASYNGKIHGGGRSFFNIVTRINQKRFNVIPCILRKEDSLKSLFEKHGVRVNYLGRGKFDPFVLFDFIRLIKSEKIHILHLNSFASHQFGRLAGAITGVPTIIHARGLTDYPYSWYQQISDWFLARFTDQAIAVSKIVKEAYIANRKIDGDKVIVMPNGVPLEEFKPLPAEQRREIKRRLGIKPDHQVVGTVTRFIELKGNRYFLEAAAKVLQILPNTNFLVVGDGPLFQELKKLSRQLKLENHVFFTGFSDNVPAILSIIDVKVVSSLSEGFGNILVEAMSMGKAIVATNVAGLKEIVTDGKTGLLVPPRDPQAMAEQIIYLLQHEKERNRLELKSQDESRKYALDVYIRNLEKVYEEVAAKRVGEILKTEK